MNVKVSCELVSLLRTVCRTCGIRNISRSSCLLEKDGSSKAEPPPPPTTTEIKTKNEVQVKEEQTQSVYVPYEERHKRALAAMEEFDSIPKYEDPVKRTGTVLKRDMKVLQQGAMKMAGFEINETSAVPKLFPSHTDIVIIGGGAIGSSIAYFLKQRVPHAFHVTVIEKDSTYAEASTSLSVGGIRQQFSLEESIEMSLFGADFIRTIDRSLAIDGEPPPSANFEPHGYLFLSGEDTAPILQHNSALQRRLGAKNVLLDGPKLKEKFPWLNTDGIALGCLGLQNEGWFDPWALLNSLKKKAINLGAEYVNGEVVGFEYKDQPHILVASHDGRYDQLERVVVKMPDGSLKAIKFGYCIIAAGAFSGEVARMAKIGVGEGMLSVPLPIEPRKRYVYVVNCPDGPGLNTPLLIDPTGTYFRREGLGGTYICGVSPLPFEEPTADNLDVDYDFFDNRVWPVLAERVPAFEKLKLRNGWAGFYEYNVMDQNGVVGFHPFYHNLFIAAGFSGHGIQHAPAVGRATMEAMLDGRYTTINLSRLGFDRLCLNEPLFEIGVV